MQPTPPPTRKDLALAEHVPPGARELAIGGIAAEELAGRFGTPLYVFAAEILRRTLARVRAALGPRVRVLYALKANPNAALARVLRLAGAGAEIASAGEIHVARAAGFAGADMHFAGPGKNHEDFALATATGLGTLNLESEAEYTALAAFARAKGARPGVAVRVNPKDAMAGSRMKMGGGSKKFGVDEPELLPLLRRIRREDVCTLRGLHVYAGTQSFDAAAWAANAGHLVDLANGLERDLGAPLASLNFGGGFGVASFEGDPDFDLERAGAGLQDRIARDARPDRTYWVELGRYLTAPAGVYLTRVVYAKTSQGKRHLILDGGMHQHGAAAGLGSVIRRAFPMVPAREPWRTGAERYTCGGPLCTPADEFAADLLLPELHAGDLLAILVSGAYGLTFSNTMFLSHPAPAEVLVDGGQAWVVRERGRPEDALRGQRLP
ncbi:MAG: diaminopimelate decarboxylase [Planctomycetes bacterium]|nr:diaminopimelate decarboxylase [Planctomycetota bacterium]